MLRPFADQLGAALVTEVVPDGPADEAGVREDDIIIAVDNKALGELPDLLEAMRRHEPGDEVTLTVLRRGDEIEIFELEVTLGRQRDEEGEIAAYLGIWYQPMGAMIQIMPRTRGPWD
jgi:S1-C subfamily serine protease